MKIIKFRFRLLSFLLFLILPHLVFAVPTSKIWDFNNAEEYTASDPAKIEIADGVGKLIGTPNRYPVTVGLNIIPNNSLSFTGSLSSFIETKGDGDDGVPSSLKYFISSDDGVTWKCWEHGTWETEDFCTGGSNASDINANISTLDVDGGEFKWKAFLKSWPPLGDPGEDEFVGTNQVELDQLEIGYTGVIIVKNVGGSSCGFSCKMKKILRGEKHCRDTRALNYMDYGVSDESLCEYPEMPVFITNENIETNTGETFIINIEVESDQTLTYRLVDSFRTNNDTEYLSINRSTGALSFDQTRNGTNSPTHLMRRSPIMARTLPLNEFLVEVEVFDGYNRTRKAFKIKIRTTPNGIETEKDIIVEPEENHNPIFFEELQVLENTTFVTNVSALDSDGDVLSYSILPWYLGNKFKINSATGKLEFKLAPNFENPQGQGNSNLYPVVVKVSDGENFSEKLLKTRVINDESDDVHENRPPVIHTLSEIIEIPENTKNVITINASDPDGDSLSYFVKNIRNLNGNKFKINRLTGELEFKEAPDFENPEGQSWDRQLYSIMIGVWDGQLETIRRLNIKVTDENNEEENIESTNKVNFVIEDLEINNENTTVMSTYRLEYKIGNRGNIDYQETANGKLFKISCFVSDDINNWDNSSILNIEDTIIKQGRRVITSIRDLDSGEFVNITQNFKMPLHLGQIKEQHIKCEVKSLKNVEETTQVDNFIIIPIHINGSQNTLPIVKKYPDVIEISENTTEIINIEASDPDGDPLKYTITNYSYKFKINQVTGKLEFKNPPDFENPQGLSYDPNLYKVLIEVTDKYRQYRVARGTTRFQGRVTRTLNIRVTDVVEEDESSEEDIEDIMGIDLHLSNLTLNPRFSHVEIDKDDLHNGNSFKLSMSLENLKEFHEDLDTNISCYLSNDENITTDDIVLVDSESKRIPQFSSSQNIYFNTSILNISSFGQYYIGCIVDSQDEIEETNEQNNTTEIIPVIIKQSPPKFNNDIYTRIENEIKILSNSENKEVMNSIRAYDVDKDSLFFTIEPGMQGDKFEFFQTHSNNVDLSFKDTPVFKYTEEGEEDENLYSVKISVWDGFNDPVEIVVKVRIVLNELSMKINNLEISSNNVTAGDSFSIDFDIEKTGNFFKSGVILETRENIDIYELEQWRIVCQTPIDYGDYNNSSFNYSNEEINNLMRNPENNYYTFLSYPLETISRSSYHISKRVSMPRMFQSTKTISCGIWDKESDPYFIDLPDMFGNNEFTNVYVDEYVPEVQENNAPVIENSEDEIYITENRLNVVIINVSDSDNDRMTTTIKSELQGDKFQLIGSNLLRFKVAPDFENPQGINNSNLYKVTIIVNDENNASAEKTLNIRVVNDEADD